jgi:HK97 family phage major capsid protein
MMTSPQELAAAAKAALESGDVAQANDLLAKAKALKATLEFEQELTAGQRLNMPVADAPAQSSGADVALKACYSQQFNGADLNGDADLVMRDLYGNYRQEAYAKAASFARFLRTGQMDQYARRVILTPQQAMKMVADGQDFSSIKTAQIESQGDLGGYLVPEDFREEVIRRIQGMTPMRQIARSMNTTRDRVTMPVVNGGDDRYIGNVRVTKVDESPTSTQAATNATYGSVTIPVHTIMGHASVSKNLIEDTTGAAAIVPLMSEEFSSAFFVFEDEQFLVGNGVGGPQGILKNATTGGPNTFAYGAVATVNSGVATKLTADAIRALPYAVATQYRQLGGMWLMSRGTLRVIKQLKAGDGTYLWSSRGDTPQLANGAPNSLEGFPIMETEVLASPTTNSGDAYTANVFPILFVTRPFYTIVDKTLGGMALERYEDSTTAKENNVVFVMRRRVGGQVTNPWGGAALKISA